MEKNTFKSTLVIVGTLLQAVILSILYNVLSRFSSVSTAPTSLPVLKFLILFLFMVLEWSSFIYNTSRIVDAYIEQTEEHPVEAEDQDKSRYRIQISLLIALGITFVSVVFSNFPYRF